MGLFSATVMLWSLYKDFFSQMWIPGAILWNSLVYLVLNSPEHVAVGMLIPLIDLYSRGLPLHCLLQTTDARWQVNVLILSVCFVSSHLCDVFLDCLVILLSCTGSIMLVQARVDQLPGFSCIGYLYICVHATQTHIRCSVVSWPKGFVGVLNYLKELELLKPCMPLSTFQRRPLHTRWLYMISASISPYGLLEGHPCLSFEVPMLVSAFVLYINKEQFFRLVHTIITDNTVIVVDQGMNNTWSLHKEQMMFSQ